MIWFLGWLLGLLVCLSNVIRFGMYLWQRFLYMFLQFHLMAHGVGYLN